MEPQHRLSKDQSSVGPFYFIQGEKYQATLFQYLKSNLAS